MSHRETAFRSLARNAKRIGSKFVQGIRPERSVVLALLQWDDPALPWFDRARRPCPLRRPGHESARP